VWKVRLCWRSTVWRPSDPQVRMPERKVARVRNAGCYRVPVVGEGSRQETRADKIRH